MRDRCAPPIAALALALALIAPAGAAGAVKTGLDRHAGMRLTLDGRVLTTKILPGRHLGAQLYGKRIDAVCSSSFFHPRHARVVRRQLWPVGAKRLSFTFGRDISRDAKWCLIEQDASDVAAVNFVRPEPIRLVAKGRGPSGAWWRLGGGSDELAAPCVLWRTADRKVRWCFTRFAERKVTLGVQQWPACAGDPYFFGVVSPAATSLRLMLADGTSTEAVLYDRPRGSRLRARFFAAAQPAGGVVRSVQALDAAGALLAERRVPDLSGEPCD